MARHPRKEVLRYWGVVNANEEMVWAVTSEKKARGLMSSVYSSKISSRNLVVRRSSKPLPPDTALKYYNGKPYKWEAEYGHAAFV